jgi:DNA-directed RNA polymerase subunit RPC12/RpoP
MSTDAPLPDSIAALLKCVRCKEPVALDLQQPLCPRCVSELQASMRSKVVRSILDNAARIAAAKAMA